jgi:hypothetical protein
MYYLDAPTRLRLQRGVEHLHRLGPRATAELLAGVATRIGGLPCILSLLDEYRNHLTPEMLLAARGDRFPSHLAAVPPDLARRVR